ncbi:MAG: hypothetical protein PHO10_05525 [Gemmiger sp.]|nr:hypothetical protein [Gemmiger sp.]
MYYPPITVDFFLGALSPSGFTGWFAQAAQEPGIQPYLLKAGPGCGKSTLLKRLADADATSPVIQRIHCSSDPDSLDGVLLPGPGALVLDATAPHTLDCKYPGAAERVISLYDALDNTRLAAHRAEILALGARNTALLHTAAAYFAFAAGLLEQRRALAAAMVDTARLAAFGARLAEKTMPPQKGCRRPGGQQHRLLSAPTPGGTTVFYDTIPALSDDQVAIHDPYGAVAPLLLAQLASHARAAGYDVILCHCPTGQQRLDHLFIPALRLAFLTANPWHPMLFASQKNIHATRWMNPTALAPHRAILRRQAKTAATLLGMACETQQAAKAVHDALEAHYIAACDFAAVDKIRTALEAELFGC